jgi:hypothetical protein
MFLLYFHNQVQAFRGVKGFASNIVTRGRAEQHVMMLRILDDKNAVILPGYYWRFGVSFPIPPNELTLIKLLFAVVFLHFLSLV